MESQFRNDTGVAPMEQGNPSSFFAKGNACLLEHDPPGPGLERTPAPIAPLTRITRLGCQIPGKRCSTTALPFMDTVSQPGPLLAPPNHGTCPVTTRARCTATVQPKDVSRVSMRLSHHSASCVMGHRQTARGQPPEPFLQTFSPKAWM